MINIRSLKIQMIIDIDGFGPMEYIRECHDDGNIWYGVLNGDRYITPTPEAKDKLEALYQLWRKNDDHVPIVRGDT